MPDDKAQALLSDALEKACDAVRNAGNELPIRGKLYVKVA